VSRARVAAIVGLVAALLAGGAIVYRATTTGATADAGPVRQNILLITLDTTRADHLGSYGSSRARTRYLDRLAAEGVRFEWAFSPAPITLPAHASVFTGLYPFEHGVRNNGNFYLAETTPTLATVLAAAGYRTAAFVSTFVLDRRYGLARGFETYDDRMETADTQVVSLEAERRGDRTSLALSAWLDRYAAGTLDPPAGKTQRSTRGAPFFAWLHLYDPHEPYRPPQPFRGAFPDSPYDGEIAFDDAIVASVLDKLQQLHLLDTTVIAVIGDHGESLGDHGEETHSMFVYDAAVRVPLILWRPGRLPAHQTVSQPVSAIDLPPTLLELAGAPPLHAPHARSLLPLLTGKAPDGPRPLYAETYLPQFYMNWAPLRMLRDGGWKYVDAPRPELYDLTRDPGETQSLVASEGRRLASMRAALTALTAGSPGAMRSGRLDPKAREKLEALGYIGGGAAPAPGPDSHADPKDMIGVFNRLRRANHAVRERQFREALPILQDVLRDSPRNAFAHLVLGSAYMGMAQYRTAIEQYRVYLELVPTSAYAHQWIAICLVRLNDQDEALREAAAALAIDPRFTDSRVLRGGILAGRGQYDAALRELRTAVETDPEKPTIRLDLAKVLTEAGRQDDARREYERILARDRDYPAALTGLGALCAAMGQPDEAVRLLTRSLQVQAAQADARFNLARVLEQQGKLAEAAAEYERAAGETSGTQEVRTAARERLQRLRGGRP